MTINQEESQAQRLTQARFRAGYASARQAAIRNGFGISTYAAHENAQNKFTWDQAVIYARTFGCTANWLMNGDPGLPSNSHIVRIAGQVMSGGMVDTSHLTPEAGIVPEVITNMSNKAECYAFIIKTDDLLPVYKNGTVLICAAPTKLIDQFIGMPCIVRSKGGDMMVREIDARSNSGGFHLSFYGHPLMRNVRIDWAAKIVATIPESEYEYHERAGTFVASSVFPGLPDLQDAIAS